MLQVKEVLATTRTQLFDPNGAGWSDTELIGYINSVQTRIVFLKPDANPVRVPLGLSPGTHQAIPLDGVALLRVLGNTASKKAVWPCNLELLKAANSAYGAGTQVIDVENYAVDETSPRLFEVSPPAINGASLDIIYGAVPPVVVDSNDTLVLPDSYKAPIIDGVLALAFDKPSKRQDRAKAMAHLSSFNQAMGIKDKMQAVVQPALDK